MNTTIKMNVTESSGAKIVFGSENPFIESVILTGSGGGGIQSRLSIYDVLTKIIEMEMKKEMNLNVEPEEPKKTKSKKRRERRQRKQLRELFD
jgi:hypothetical protein